MARNTASTKLKSSERIGAYKLVNANTVIIGQSADGKNIVKYTEGWSDQRVAEEVGKPEAVRAVAAVRVEEVGSFLGVMISDNRRDGDEALLTLIAELRGDLNRAIRSINMLAKTEGLTAALIEEKSNGH